MRDGPSSFTVTTWRSHRVELLSNQRCARLMGHRDRPLPETIYNALIRIMNFSVDHTTACPFVARRQRHLVC